MKIVVTGAAGFLGRHVSREFLSRGWDVTGFDQTEFEEDGMDTVVGDLTNPEDVEAVSQAADVIAHVGAIGDVYLAGSDPTLAANVNVVGTSNVVQSAVRNNTRVVYASTWEVYGEPEVEPLTEDHPTRPDHPYNITKLGGEALLISATELQDLSGVALRLGTAYGSGLRPNSVFRIFIDRARAGEPITIQGDGKQGRQFTHASDVAKAFAIAAESDVSGSAFNIVAPESTSIGDLAQKIVNRFPTELTFGEPRPGDVPPALVSADKARRILGWEAVMPFDDGLGELIDSVVQDG